MNTEVKEVKETSWLALKLLVRCLVVAALFVLASRAQAQWFNMTPTCTNVTTLPLLSGFAPRVATVTISTPAETVLVTNINTNDTFTFWYWMPQYGQGPVGTVNNGATNMFQLASLTTNVTASTMVALGQTNGSGVPTNGGNFYFGIPSVVIVVTNQLYGTVSNSTWATASPRTNGILSNP